MFIVGVIVGWLAGKIMKGVGFGLFVNIVLGIIGVYVGNWLFGVLDISIGIGFGIINIIIIVMVGLVVVLFVVGLLKK